MKTINITMEIKTWGSVLNCRVFLEKNDDAIGLWTPKSANSFSKELHNYPIEGPLDVKMTCRGKNGASATLTIKIEGQKDETLVCEIQKGSSTTSKSITLNQTTLL